MAFTAEPGLGSDFALQDRLIQLYAEANPSVVYIINPSVGSGTGFVYDDQGHIVTNDHVVEGACGRLRSSSPMVSCMPPACWN